jgi:hypothetical protein
LPTNALQACLIDAFSKLDERPDLVPPQKPKLLLITWIIHNPSRHQIGDAEAASDGAAVSGTSA